MSKKDYQPGPLAEVSHDQSGEKSTLIFTKRLNHSPEAVWKVLTDPEEMVHWAPFKPSRTLAEKGKLTLTAIDKDNGETYESEVTRVEPPSVLEYTLGTNVLIWKLERDGDGTKLTLRHTVDGPEWLSKIAAGWQVCIEVADRFLAGTPIGRIVGSEVYEYGWDELNEKYAKLLGTDGEA